MGQLLVRDVPEDTIAALKERAKENGRSTEAEHRAILQETVKSKREKFWEDAAELREELRARGLHFDSAVIIRQDRDSRE
jgi:plasmid stability protein